MSDVIDTLMAQVKAQLDALDVLPAFRINQSLDAEAEFTELCAWCQLAPTVSDNAGSRIAICSTVQRCARITGA